MKLSKSIFSHSILYSLTIISSSVASILLLPVYTRYLSQADYGILEVLTYTNGIFRIILISGFHTALSRFYHGEEVPDRKKKVVSTGIFFVFFSGLIGCYISYIFNNELANLILGDSSLTGYINLNLGILLADMMVTISGTFFIISKQPKVYVIYCLGRLVAAISGNLFFIVGLKLGAVGMLYGNLLSLGLVAVILTSHSLLINGLEIDASILIKLVKFGSPMIPAMLCATIMHNADRFLIRHYTSLSDVGIYGLGYRFPFMLSALVLESFNRVWTGSTMYELAKQPDAKDQYAKIATYFMVIFVLSQFALSVFSISVVRIFADSKFIMASRVIPIVALGLCFHAFYTFFNVGAFLKNKTWLLNFSYIPAAIVNVVGNIILLPRFGYMAAAWMTVATYSIFSLFAYFSCKGALDIPFEFRKLALLFFYAIGVYLVSAMVHVEGFIPELFKNFIFLLLFVGMVYLGGCISDNEREQLKEMTGRFVNGRNQ